MPHRSRPTLSSLTALVAALVIAGSAAACGASSTSPPPAVSSSAPSSAASGLPSVEPSAGASSPTGSAVTPEPGPSFVAVDGRDVAIDCRGEGQPTVLLESGLGGRMGTWDVVIEEIAKTARVCRYDRPTSGTDGPADLPRTADRMVEQLRSWLAAAGETPPYVLVGHSLGGLNVQLFARQHSDEVLGVVFVDAIHPDFDTKIEEILSPEQLATRRADLERNDEGVTAADIRRSAELVKAAPGFPPVSTVVIRHGRPFGSSDPAWPTEGVEALWAELAEDLATLGDPPRPVVVASKSGHSIQEEEPELVIEAIEYCLEGMR